MNINDANTPLQNNEDVEYKFNPKLIIQFAIISIAAITYHAFAWGFILYKYYHWFAMPISPNIPNISFYQAIGLSLIISLFKNNIFVIPNKEYRDDSFMIFIIVISPIIALFIGFLINSYISNLI